MHAPTLQGIILISLVALLLFGPKKLPELGRSVGKALREFKYATSGMSGEEERKDHGEERKQ
ncbi:sec-independent protein translocase protein TatA [Marininema mesophilum]|uniref:Sec-independent protein translocase protein TatA n=1 Tax=Marininema mesophilum TaxID=1048340 RepID=A0A1H2PZ11_9BACL|nr:twin-arginine translocase TatA/TatE family subunit [Marininema mesophilum]SDW00093.1 sec-independent protein translocase protein TatA [Marininema mesophilum]